MNIRWTRILSGTLLCAALAALLMTGSMKMDAAQAQEFENPGFEGEYAAVRARGANDKGVVGGTTAAGWIDNSSWADVTVNYGRETENPHGGEAAQLVDVQRVNSGAVQFVQGATLQKDHAYTTSFWLRSDSRTPLDLVWQKTTAPYTAYARQTLTLTPEWKQHTLSGVATEDAEIYVMLRATAPIRFWVDDAQFQDMTAAENNAPARRETFSPTLLLKRDWAPVGVCACAAATT